MAAHATQHRTPRSAPAAPAAPGVAGPRQAQLAKDKKLLQGAGLKKKDPLQGAGLKKKPVQGAGLKKKPVQKASIEEEKPAQRAANRTGLPDALKSGIEGLSGMSMDHVRVHQNSSKPAQLGAHAYAQGSDIHLAPGQAHHLPHEAWHVVQQAQGRVKPTMQMKEGVPVNDDAGLEREADVMGARALVQRRPAAGASVQLRAAGSGAAVVQRFGYINYGGLTHGSGTEVHVGILGKNDPDLGQGSSPSVRPAWWPTSGDAADYFSTYVVQGHLLNEHLGGPGTTMANLTPITKSTNSTHFRKVEDDVKQAVANNHQVEYRVRADYSSHPPISDFGSNIPLAAQNDIANYLPYMAGEIAADYTLYDQKTSKEVGGLPGELLIKNEGAHLKGPF